MLTGFDWLRRSRNGQELLATLISLAERPDLFAEAEEIGPPPCCPAESVCTVLDTSPGGGYALLQDLRRDSGSQSGALRPLTLCGRYLGPCRSLAADAAAWRQGASPSPPWHLYPRRAPCAPDAATTGGQALASGTGAPQWPRTAGRSPDLPDDGTAAGAWDGRRPLLGRARRGVPAHGPAVRAVLLDPLAGASPAQA